MHRRPDPYPGKNAGTGLGYFYILGQGVVTEIAPPALHSYMASASFFKRAGEST